ESAVEGRHQVGQIIGTSPAMLELFARVKKVANSAIPVHIRGETGTGKELIAKAIHFGGQRRKGPFVAINCAAIPESLQESELFGHEKGAFTGAHVMRKGCFERAHRGTLLLDEVGEMGLGLQAKLLRVLQDFTVYRVGSDKAVHVDVRVLTATNRDLEQMAAAKVFRD
ncbi:MAG: sigma-54 factor interaction domain-containing protein, partial [Gammaproteobacteria bacterium]|nr:sigma-54 factor interaction domain-containing protein [Gammaproteobacteria bacterium]